MVEIEMSVGVDPGNDTERAVTGFDRGQQEKDKQR